MCHVNDYLGQHEGQVHFLSTDAWLALRLGLKLVYLPRICGLDKLNAVLGLLH